MVRILISLFVNLTLSKGCLGLKVYPAAHSIRNQELNVCILILLACCDYECLLFDSFPFFVSFVAQAHFKADFAYVEFSLLAI